MCVRARANYYKPPYRFGVIRLAPFQVLCGLHPATFCHDTHTNTCTTHRDTFTTHTDTFATHANTFATHKKQGGGEDRERERGRERERERELY